MGIGAIGLEESMALFDKQIRAASASEKPTKLSDGGGLYLLVKPNGSKLWQMSYRFERKQKTLSFGQYPERTLAEARAKRDEAKRLLISGIDPSTQMNRKVVIEALRERTVASKKTEFANVARDWYVLQMDGGRWEPKFAPRIWHRIETHLIPELGETDIADVTVQDVLGTLRKMEEAGLSDTVRKVKGYLGGIMRYGVVEGLCAADLTRDLKDSLRPVPMPTDHPWIRMEVMPDLFADMARPHKDAEMTRIALRLTMHTVLRSNEFRSGRWDQIKGDEWHVPAIQMKKVKGVRREHVVPLSRQSLALLAKLREITGHSAMMFPGLRPGRPMSENTVLFSIYGMGWKGRVSNHGFRKTFSTHANESGEWNSDWIEVQLAHLDRNSVRSAYNKALYLKHRKPMMQWWSDELDRMEAIATERMALEHELSDILG